MAVTIPNYVAPQLIADIDDTSIHRRMLSHLPSDIDKTEGGFAYDFTYPAALEKAELMVGINEAIQAAFPAWSWGIFLDQLAQSLGMVRRPATASAGTIEVHGVSGTVMVKGFTFATPQTAISPNVIFASTETVEIDENGIALVPVQCTVTGTKGNVPADCVTLQVNKLQGITGVTNPLPITGGTEEESDNSLRVRIIEREQQGESSYIGCDADYKRWAQTVAGVGDVVVIPEWQGPGTGTVRLIVMDSNGDSANQTILDNVYDYIISPNDRASRLAPIGAILTVDTADTVPINVEAVVKLDGTQTLSYVISKFTSNLKEYFIEAKAESDCVWTRICAKLSETEGVHDYQSVLVNGGTANIPIDIDEYPGIGTITITEA